jgi:cytidylyltransferase family
MKKTPPHIPKPKNSAGRDLKAAIPVGIGLFTIVLLAIFVIPFGWYPLVALAILLGQWEVITRVTEAGYVVQRWCLLFGGQLMLWLSWPFGTTGLVSGFVAAVLLLMFSRLFYAGQAAEQRHPQPQQSLDSGASVQPEQSEKQGKQGPKNYVRDTSMGVFILTWIPLFGSFAAMMSLLRGHDDVPGSMFIITFMLCVIASDTGGYIAGVMFGSHPMAPTVSPKKSWEGFAGSTISSAVVGALMVGNLLYYDWWWGVLLGFGLAVCATLGDLLESQFKRELGIKDMSNMVPGHGGVMDRLDGMLPSAMVTWLVLSVIAL